MATKLDRMVDEYTKTAKYLAAIKPKHTHTRTHQFRILRIITEWSLPMAEWFYYWVDVCMLNHFEMITLNHMKTKTKQT